MTTDRFTKSRCDELRSHIMQLRRSHTEVGADQIDLMEIGLRCVDPSDDDLEIAARTIFATAATSMYWGAQVAENKQRYRDFARAALIAVSFTVVGSMKS